MDLRFGLAVVTGGGGGLGREIAVGLARVGAAVLVVDRDAEAAARTAELVATSRTRGWALQADLRHESDLVMVAARALDLGGADMLVNNAGGWTPGEQYPAAEPAAWSATLDLNLRAPMRLTQLFCDGVPLRRGVRRGEPGAVVNIASSAALPEEDGSGYGSPEYAAAKAGLVRFTTAMARPDVAALARVTAVVPGWIGLERAHDEWASLSEARRAALPPLVPPSEVVGAVLALLARGRPGEVVELLG